MELFLDSIASTFKFLLNNDLIYDDYSKLDPTGLKEVFKGRINVALLMLIKIQASQHEDIDDLKDFQQTTKDFLYKESRKLV